MAPGGSWVTTVAYVPPTGKEVGMPKYPGFTVDYNSKLKRLQMEVEAMQKYPSGEVAGTLVWDLSQWGLCVQPEAVTKYIDLMEATLDHGGVYNSTQLLNELQYSHLYESTGTWKYQLLRYLQRVDMMEAMRDELHQSWQRCGHLRPPLDLVELIEGKRAGHHHLGHQQQKWPELLVPGLVHPVLGLQRKGRRLVTDARNLKGAVELAYEGLENNTKRAYRCVTLLVRNAASGTAHVLRCQESSTAKPVYSIFEDSQHSTLEDRLQLTGEYLQNERRKFEGLSYVIRLRSAPWVARALALLESHVLVPAAVGEVAREAHVAIRSEHDDEMRDAQQSAVNRFNQALSSGEPDDAAIPPSPAHSGVDGILRVVVTQY
ncbi:hypothetical protein CYMTET_55670 [Cymbomonas tetramitiformis]|uniref:Uncharacterized protein n=1 Tax=Cymbomonas tetramitiformis TaxID=36881 RepID=A0AAE0ENC8_9CHLO|nr:hypothetical protein CYMTET_55670 [Cymbomonas tetramitiformis]